MKPSILPLFGMALLGFLPSAHAADQPVAAAHEHRHRTDLENAYVRTLQVTMQPGQQTDYHLHSIPSVVVELSDAHTIVHQLGHAPDPLRTTHPGETRYAAYDEKPITHQVSNRGTTVFDVMDIELLQPNRKPADGYPPAPPAPAELLVAKNQVRTYRLVLPAGAAWNVPASSAAHLIVAYAGAFDSVASGHERFVGPHEPVSLTSPGAAPAEAVVLELESTAGN